MALLFFWRCEGTTLDGTHDYSAGDTTATLNSGALINTDAARFGTNGLDIPTASDTARFNAASIINGAEGSVALSVRFTTFASGRSLLMAFGTNVLDQIRIETTGTDDATGRELRVRHRTTAGGAENVVIATTAADLELNVWYGVVARWDTTADSLKLEIYNSDGSLRTEVSSSSAITAQTDIVNLWWGEDGAGAIDMHMDNLFIADTYEEPLEDFLDITSYTEYGAAGGDPEGSLIQGKLLRGGLLLGGVLTR
jgi:hypothetical protein